MAEQPVVMSTSFFDELWQVFFGGPWYATVFFLLIAALGIATWVGALRSPVAVRLPGSTAAIVFDVAAILGLMAGIALYRTIWGNPEVPVFAFMLPLIGAFGAVIAFSSFWLFWTQKPPNPLVPRWVRETRAALHDQHRTAEQKKPGWALEEKDEPR